MKRKELGKLGEEWATRFLENAGMEILQRNFRIRGGEIDIIARDGKVIVFVEVKTCATDSFGEPETWVTLRKQKRIGYAALSYLQQNDLAESDCRFDVVTVQIKDGKAHFHHVIDAFWLPEGIW